MGHSQTSSPATGTKTAVIRKAARYRLAKCPAICASSDWAAQKRAMEASSQLNVATWASVSTE